MSFSKAKLKRFNEVPVGESPCSERKEHIKKFFKEVRDSCKDSKGKDAQFLFPSTPSASDSESVKSSKSLRFFRTPSLPKRLRFRQNSDVTPKKEFQKELFSKEALEAAQIEIKNKSEVLKDYETQIDELKVEIFQLKENNDKEKQDTGRELLQKDDLIKNLSKDIENLKDENTKLKNEEEKLLTKSEELQNEIKMLLQSHEKEITFLISTNSECEKNQEKLMTENQKYSEENTNLKQEIHGILQEIGNLKSDLENRGKELSEKSAEIQKIMSENSNLINEIDSFKGKIQNDILLYAEESQKMLNDMNLLKTEKSKLLKELTNKNELIKSLENDISDRAIEIDLIRDEIRYEQKEEILKISNKYEKQIQTIKDINEMKIKEFETIKLFEIAELKKQQNELEKYHFEEIRRLNQTHSDELHSKDLQNELKLKEFDKILNLRVENEIHNYKEKVQIEITKLEHEKQSLKTLFEESAHEMLQERNDKIKCLKHRLSKGMRYYVDLCEKLESEVHDIREELEKALQSKYSYELALSNHQKTSNVIMERCRQSDMDVDSLKKELETIKQLNNDFEMKNINLENEVATLNKEIATYKNSLEALRMSSQALEYEMKEKERVYEKLMLSEEETLETVNKIGKLFNERIDENLDIYFEMYNDLKQKYEAREIYIKDMKTLLDDFANGIELARFELDNKDKQIIQFEQDYKNIQLENMQYKFKCEQYEKYEQQTNNINNSNGNLIPTNNCDTYLMENNILEENQQIKCQLNEQLRRNELLQQMIELESENVAENSKLKKKIEETDKALKTSEQIAQDIADKYNELKSQMMNSQNCKNTENLRETNLHLKNKLLQLKACNQEPEATISDLQQKIILGTPRKMKSSNKISTTPKTPKSPKTPKTPKNLLSQFSGKENRSPSTTIEIGRSPKGILKPRN